MFPCFTIFDLILHQVAIMMRLQSSKDFTGQVVIGLFPGYICPTMVLEGGGAFYLNGSHGCIYLFI